MATYAYDAWGMPRGTTTVSTEYSTIASLNPFRYRGYIYDSETGFYYLQSRYYDPETCRFLNMDSVDYADPEMLNGLNLYAYGLNNPVMYVDPTGHEPEWWHWVAAGLAVACGVVVMVTFAGAIGGIIGASATVVNAMMISAGLATATAGAMNLFTQATNRVEDIDVGSLLADMTVSGIFGMVTGGISSVLSTFVSGGVGTKLLADMATQGVLNAGLSMISYLLQVPFSGEGLTLEGLTMATTTGFISGCAFKLPPLRSFLLAVGFELANYAETIFANLKKLIDDLLN